jgi:diguanylate cyclase (GGDEF)-like protein
MLFDLISGMTHMTAESDAIDQIMGLFDMLFATRKAVYASVTEGRVTACRARPDPAPGIEECQSWLDSGRKDGARADEGDIFFRITYRQEVLGLLEISGMEFPERSGEYFALAAPIAQVCGLAISNARMYQDLRTLAITDSLTGLINRRQFFEQAEAEVARARRYGRPLAAVMIDIDFFKSVNDAYGHQAGDGVLAEVARRIRGELRASDICARYGGEEFVLLMPETDSSIALQAAERIRARIEGLVLSFGGEAVRTTLSLGVAMLDPSCADLEALLGRSDQALYESKAAGRNRVTAFAQRGL